MEKNTVAGLEFAAHLPLIHQGFAMSHPVFEFLDLLQGIAMQHEVVPFQLRLEQLGRKIDAESGTRHPSRRKQIHVILRKYDAAAHARLSHWHFFQPEDMLLGK